MEESWGYREGGKRITVGTEQEVKGSLGVLGRTLEESLEFKTIRKEDRGKYW